MATKAKAKEKSVDSNSEYIKKLKRDVNSYTALKTHLISLLQSEKAIQEFDKLCEKENEEAEQRAANLLKENIDPVAISLNNLIRLKVMEEYEAEGYADRYLDNENKIIYNNINLYGEIDKVVDNNLDYIFTNEIPLTEALDLLNIKLKERLEELVEEEKLKSNYGK